MKQIFLKQLQIICTSQFSQPIIFQQITIQANKFMFK